jgi:cardiolipin synthase
VNSALHSAIANCAAKLPPAALEAAIAALDSATSIDEARRRVVESVVLSHHRDAIRMLLGAWMNTAPTMPPSAIGLALGTAAALRSGSASEKIELVWTGPAAETIFIRNTEQALLEVIDSARHVLIVITFAAHSNPVIGNALKVAIDRGVRVIFVAETCVDSGRRFSVDATRLLGDLSSAVEIYIWPLDRRPVDENGRMGTLHAKCAVADNRCLLVSSANLTENAMTLNIEIGILITGGHLPADVSRQIVALINSGVLVRKS